MLSAVPRVRSRDNVSLENSGEKAVTESTSQVTPRMKEPVICMLCDAAATDLGDFAWRFAM